MNIAPYAKFVVRRLNKNNKFSRERPSRLDFCQIIEDALSRKAYLERLNPHLRYGIDKL
jgi:hypothetical protein